MVGLDNNYPSNLEKKRLEGDHAALQLPLLIFLNPPQGFFGAGLSWFMKKRDETICNNGMK